MLYEQDRKTGVRRLALALLALQKSWRRLALIVMILNASGVRKLPSGREGRRRRSFVSRETEGGAHTTRNRRPEPQVPLAKHLLLYGSSGLGRRPAGEFTFPARLGGDQLHGVVPDCEVHSQGCCKRLQRESLKRQRIELLN